MSNNVVTPVLAKEVSPVNIKTLHPGPLNLLRNLPGMVRDPLGFLEAQAHQHGDMVNLLGKKIYLVNHPDLIEAVLVGTNRAFIKGINTGSPDKAPTLAGNGLVVSEGAYWLRQRRLAQPAFRRECIAGYGSAMVDYTSQMLDGWQDGQTREIHQDMMRVTLEIVAHCLFNADLRDEVDAIGELLAVAMDALVDPALMLPFPSKRKKQAEQNLARLDKAIYRLIEQREASQEDVGDLLSMLLAARDEDGSHMTPKQVRDELITMIIAGHETTAVSLTWAWWLLAQHPAVEEQLAAEVNSVLAGRVPLLSDLAALPYTDAVIKETMRLYPPVWAMARLVTQDTELAGLRLKKGARVVTSQWVMHRDPRYWEAPAEFRPARWLNGLEKQLPRYAYFPFGGGPRVCIGQSFAQMEAVLMLATIAQRYRLTLAEGQTVRPRVGVTLRPKGGLRVVTQQRS